MDGSGKNPAVGATGPRAAMTGAGGDEKATFLRRARWRLVGVALGAGVLLAIVLAVHANMVVSQERLLETVFRTSAQSRATLFVETYLGHLSGAFVPARARA